MNKNLITWTTFLFLLWAFSLTKGRTEEGLVIVKEEPLACPVTSLISLDEFTFLVSQDSEKLKNVLNGKDKALWKTNLNGDKILITFKDGLVLERIAFSLTGEDQNEFQKIGYEWVGESGNWPNVSGQFLVKGDGKVHGYFLGYFAQIPENVATKQFILDFPKGVSLHTLLLSPRRSDRAIETCPKPEMFLKVNKAYQACLKNPDDKFKASSFVGLLVKMMDKYDCRRKYDYKPIPAWWLCGEGYDYRQVSSQDDPEKWFNLLSKLKTHEARNLFGSELFRSTLDGAIAEDFIDASKEAEKKLKAEKE